MSWKDERLKHDADQAYIISEIEDSEMMWKPDLYFVNARKSDFHDVTVPNTYYRVYNNGEIFYSARYGLKHST